VSSTADGHHDAAAAEAIMGAGTVAVADQYRGWFEAQFRRRLERTEEDAAMMAQAQAQAAANGLAGSAVAGQL
jgi:hypothetical protein